MRVVIYCRVSTAEQVAGYSLTAQRFAVERHCRDQGYEVVGHFADEGVSGKHESLSKRPGFKTAIEFVESGGADAIAVHKLDRFARNARVFHDAIHRLKNRVIFVADGIDPNTPVGELMAGVMAQFAQYFSRNLANEVKKGLDGRRREGLYNGGPMPFAVRKDPDAKDPKKAIPVPDTVPVLCTIADHRTWSRYDALLHIFNQTVQGVSSIRISNELRAMGFELTPPGIRHIVLNRFYLGEIPIGHRSGSPYATQYAPGAHAPIIDRELCDAAHVAATTMPCLRRVKSVRRSAQTWALTGMLSCKRCNGAIHVKGHRDGTRAECYARYDRQRCDQPSFKIAKIEPQIEEILTSMAIPEEVVAAVEARFSPQRRDTRRQISALQLQRTRLNELYIEGALTKEQYIERAARIESELAQLDVRQESDASIQFGQLLRDLPEMYRRANQEQRNRLLRLVFEGFLIDSYTIVGIKPRPKLAALLGALPPNVEPFDPATFPNVESNLGNSFHVGTRPLENGWWLPPPVTPGGAPYNYVPKTFYPDVFAAWQSGETMVSIARRYRVSRQTIGKIVHRVLDAKSA